MPGALTWQNFSKVISLVATDNTLGSGHNNEQAAGKTMSRQRAQV